ncbi:MAG: transglycosylase SLT domain-containing protein [Bradymonadia bacterium]
MSAGVVFSILLGLAQAKDMQPVKLGNSDSKIRELIAQREYLRAANMVSRKSDGALLVKGHLLLRADRARDALIMFDAIKKPPEDLANFYFLRKAAAHLHAEQPQKAIEALQRIERPELFGAAATMIQARCHQELEQHAQARKVLKKVLKNGRSHERAEALYRLASVELAAGNPKAAFKHLRGLDVGYPTSRHRGRIGGLLKTLFKSSPRLKKKWQGWSTEEIVSKSEKLLKRHKNKAVVEALQKLKIKDTARDLQCRRLYALARALRKLRKWKRARPLINQAVEVCSAIKHELAPWALHLAGKAAERLSHEVEAAEIFTRQMTDNGSHRLADDGAYFVTRHLIEDLDDIDRAETELIKFVKLFPNGDMMDRAIFFVAINAFEKGLFKQALRVIKLDTALSGQEHNYRNMGRTEYWTGRILDKLKRREESYAQYELALKKYPLSWYSILAYSRLREFNKERADALADKVFSTPGHLEFQNKPTKQGPEWRQARALARHGLAQAAWQSVRRAKAKSQSGQWQMAKILDAAGAAHLSHNILRRQLTSFRRVAPVGDAKSAWEVAFPRPLKGLMSDAAKQAAIPVNLARSITREESGFHPGLESSANAIGLMQLILPTARSMAKKADGKINGTSLRRPALNVRLGTRYLRHVYTNTKAVYPLVPAGYNAGGGALKRWLRKRGGLDLDLFVELIPYEEARGYTKRVNSTWGTYKFLEGQSLKALYLGQSTLQSNDANQ